VLKGKTQSRDFYTTMCRSAIFVKNVWFGTYSKLRCVAVARLFVLRITTLMYEWPNQPSSWERVGAGYPGLPWAFMPETWRSLAIQESWLLRRDSLRKEKWKETNGGKERIRNCLRFKTKAFLKRILDAFLTFLISFHVISTLDLLQFLQFQDPPPI